MTGRIGVVAGAALALSARILLRRALLAKFRADVRRLDGGDYSSLLAVYADDAVLRFNDGPHRWAGEHRGKAAIEQFLRNFVAAGLHGTIRDLWIGGPPWAMSIVVRFDDHAHAPDGEQIYANRTALMIRTRWGKIVEHDDFYEDTGRILDLEAKLSELGVTQAGPAPVAASQPGGR
jgi:ketosteroid isomerase-like protein